MDTSTKTRKRIINMTLAAMFLALGQLLPFVTGQIPQIGKMLSPMHIPILLCGFFCGWQYAAIIGFICPLLRSMLFGMPVMYPSAVGMAFELMTYGLLSGLLSAKLGKDKLWKIYVALIGAMLGGRIVWGIAQVILLGLQGNTFTFEAFLAGAFINAVPGIIVQLVLIPVLVRAIRTQER